MNCLRLIKHEAAEAPKLKSPSPRKRILRWMKQVVKKINVVKLGKKVERECTEGTHNSSDSSTTTTTDESRNHRQESMLNHGVTCSLLYIAAASKNELKKMKELHKEMDTTLQRMKAVLRREDSPEPESKPCPFPEKETPAPCESMKRNKSKQPSCSQPSRQSHLKLRASIEQETYDKSKEGSKKGIEELETELEAELEHLQLQLDADELLSKYSRHHSAKMMVEDTNSSSRINPGEVPVEVRNGVLPIELERRLHGA